MKALTPLGLVALCLTACACSGDAGTPTGPTSTEAMVIRIVGIDGAMSFSPDPATVPAGRAVVWHNTDTSGHRIVLNDRSAQTDFLAPGATSHPMRIDRGGHYHCLIHPDMVGIVVPDDAEVPVIH